jgi:hypothetical protein
MSTLFASGAPERNWPRNRNRPHIDTPLINNDMKFRISAGLATTSVDAALRHQMSTAPVTADNEDSP